MRFGTCRRLRPLGELGTHQLGGQAPGLGRVLQGLLLVPGRPEAGRQRERLLGGLDGLVGLAIDPEQPLAHVPIVRIVRLHGQEHRERPVSHSIIEVQVDLDQALLDAVRGDRSAAVEVRRGGGARLADRGRPIGRVRKRLLECLAVHPQVPLTPRCNDQDLLDVRERLHRLLPVQVIRHHVLERVDLPRHVVDGSVSLDQQGQRREVLRTRLEDFADHLDATLGLAPRDQDGQNRLYRRGGPVEILLVQKGLRNGEEVLVLHAVQIQDRLEGLGRLYGLAGRQVGLTQHLARDHLVGAELARALEVLDHSRDVSELDRSLQEAARSLDVERVALQRAGVGRDGGLEISRLRLGAGRGDEVPVGALVRPLREVDLAELDRDR